MNINPTIFSCLFVLAFSLLGQAQVVNPLGQEKKDEVFRLMDSIIANKKTNNFIAFKRYELERYDKFQLYVGKYGRRLKKLKPLKKYNSVFDHTDSINGHTLLPIYMSESISKKFVDDSLSINEDILVAHKSTGENFDNLTAVTDKLLENIQLYDDYFQILNKSFTSPLTKNYSLFYNYYLEGNVRIKKEKYYKIRFEPKYQGDLAFSGTMLIHAKTWAVQDITMHTSDKINLNYIKRLTIHQEYRLVKKSWVVDKFETWVTLSALKWKHGEDLLAHRYTSFKNTIVDNPRKVAKDYNALKAIKANDTEIESTAYWQKARHKPLGKNEKYNYAIADTINEVPVIQKAKRAAAIAISGYMELGKISLYQLNTFYSSNPIEDNRFKFGLITNKYFSKKIQLQGYAAYGTKDKEIKYKGGILYALNNAENRLLVGASYKYDLEQLGVSPEHIPIDNFITVFSQVNKKVKLTFVRDARFYFEKEWTKGVVSKVTLLNRELRPLGTIAFEKNSDGTTNTIEQVHALTSTEIQLNSRFSISENFYIKEFRRISLGSRYPILSIDLTLGLKNLIGSDYNYQKLKTSLIGKYRIHPLGYMQYNLEAGKIFGTVPFPLTTIHFANQTLAYDVEGFNCMNYFEFASDAYVSLYLDHHFDGFFLNKIPYVQRAKLREVISARGVVGNLHDRNKNEMNLPIGMGDVRRPYVEYSVGIENIFKVLRIEYIWRGTHVNSVNTSDNWAIKARFFLTF